MEMKISRKTSVLESLIDKLEKLEKASVSSGYFPESGIHQDSGLPYAELMFLHEYGYSWGTTEIIPRPVREVTMRSIQEDADVWQTVVSQYLKGQSNLNNTLGKLGNHMTMTAQSIFGSGKLPPNAKVTANIKGKNSPLVDSGDLRDAWTWKASLTGIKG